MTSTLTLIQRADNRQFSTDRGADCRTLKQNNGKATIK